MLLKVKKGERGEMRCGGLGPGSDAGGRYICVLFVLPAVRLVIMSAGGGEGFPSPLSSRGDCHQFASWHLNYLLQIRVFEMQMQRETCVCPDKLKDTRGRSEKGWGKKETKRKEKQHL